jgi:hypothetical protein
MFLLLRGLGYEVYFISEVIFYRAIEIIEGLLAGIHTVCEKSFYASNSANAAGLVRVDLTTITLQ